jgi:hypothetical protein
MVLSLLVIDIAVSKFTFYRNIPNMRGHLILAQSSGRPDRSSLKESSALNSH